MKVKIKNTNSVVDSVKMSECFWYKGLLYMRVTVGDVTKEVPDIVYAVLLTTGRIEKFCSDVQVELVDCSVVSTSDIPQEKDKWEV